MNALIQSLTYLRIIAGPIIFMLITFFDFYGIALIGSVLVVQMFVYIAMMDETPDNII